MDTDIDIIILCEGHDRKLHEFFIRNKEDYTLFHPHGYSITELGDILTQKKRDIYSAIFGNGDIIAYGILRGWDEGYSIPSLGIMIDKEYRQVGLFSLYMKYLHTICKIRNCDKVRLSVLKKNTKAVALYRGLGYNLVELNSTELVGTKTL